MTNHPKRKVVYVLRKIDGTVFGPYTTLRAARFDLAQFLSPRYPAREIFVGAKIERFGRMTDNEARQFGGELVHARIIE